MIEKLLRDEDGVAHVVGISGGKDSVALAFALQTIKPRPYNYLFTPTGDELPEMVAHISAIENRLGAPILRITNGTLHSTIKNNSMLPNCHARFCTRILKLKPAGDFFTVAAPVVAYVGLRADEDEREGTRPGGDSASIKTEVVQDFPFQRWGWGITEVWAFLDAMGIAIPDRTDCARCPYQRLGEWFILWRDYPDIYADAEAQEDHYGHTFRSPSRDSWPASLKDLRSRFMAGERPEISLQMMEKRRGMCRVCSL
jgi:3'-phosphoadenosine 5'-phosphosulfate sulfotransferase (PAPS reductase)/FAD synthetase